MTKEDKKLIADYMGWKRGCDYHVPCVPAHEEVCDDCRYVVYKNFDLNDAGVCVAEMQKRGEWTDYRLLAVTMWMNTKSDCEDITAWLMTMEDRQAKNFFKAFVEWRKIILKEKVEIPHLNHHTLLR